MCELTAAFCPLGEIADTNPETLPANTPSASRFRYIDLSAVEQGVIDWDAVQEMTFAAAPSRARRIAKPLDTLFGTVRPNLQSHGHIGKRESGSLVASTGFSVIRARDGVSHPAYLFHSIMSSHVTAQAVRNAIGSSYPAVNDADVKQFQIFLPTFREQEEIAEILDTLDTAIHETEAIIAKLKAVKQGLLHDLLTRGIDANGELRSPQTESPHLYKPSPLGWIPKEWGVQPLSGYTACDITYGIVQAGPHIPNGVPYIRTGDMAGDALVRESMLCTSRRIANSYARSEVRTGEIVMAIRATVGKVLPVPDDLDGANLTQGTARISPNSKTDGVFLLWAIRHSRAQQAIQLEIKGTTFAEITLGALRQVPIAAPIDIGEQREIAKRLTAIDERLQHEQESLAKHFSEKSGLMDDLLTGRVRVTPLLESAAS